MKLEEIKKLNIYEKMSLITDEIGVIEKNLNVQVNKNASYKAVSERDVLDAVKPTESKYRVYSYPTKRTILESEVLVKETEYNGKWNLYFVKRDFSSDLLGMPDIGTGKADFDEGVVYELSDEKFIFNLMNFEKHACYPMANIFDILNKNYQIINGVGEHGGYHGQILISRLFSQIKKENDIGREL